MVLYEYLGEEYPEVLGSILGALKAIVNVIGMTKMTPPIKDLLPRLTPILKNRHEKVSLSIHMQAAVYSRAGPVTSLICSCGLLSINGLDVQMTWRSDLLMAHQTLFHKVASNVLHLLQGLPSVSVTMHVC